MERGVGRGRKLDVVRGGGETAKESLTTRNLKFAYKYEVEKSLSSESLVSKKGIS